MGAQTSERGNPRVDPNQWKINICGSDSRMAFPVVILRDDQLCVLGVNWEERLAETACRAVSGRSSQFLGQRGRGAALAWIIPVPPAQVRSDAIPGSSRHCCAARALAKPLAIGNGGRLQFFLRTEMGIERPVR